MVVSARLRYLGDAASYLASGALDDADDRLVSLARGGVDVAPVARGLYKAVTAWAETCHSYDDAAAAQLDDEIESILVRAEESLS
jgi:hypothetical protein